MLFYSTQLNAKLNTERLSLRFPKSSPFLSSSLSLPLYSSLSAFPTTVDDDARRHPTRRCLSKIWLDRRKSEIQSGLPRITSISVTVIVATIIAVLVWRKTCVVRIHTYGIGFRFNGLVSTPPLMLLVQCDPAPCTQFPNAAVAINYKFYEGRATFHHMRCGIQQR